MRMDSSLNSLKVGLLRNNKRLSPLKNQKKES